MIRLGPALHGQAVSLREKWVLGAILVKFGQFWRKKMRKIGVEGGKDHFFGLPRPFFEKIPRVQPFFSVFLKFQVLLTFSPYFTKKKPLVRLGKVIHTDLL